jgi:cell division septal protein FtsQ
LKVQKTKGNAGYQSKVQKKSKKSRKKKSSGIKSFILFVLFLSAFVAFALSPVFNIKSIETRGNKHIKSDDLSAASDVVTEQTVSRA